MARTQTVSREALHLHVWLRRQKVHASLHAAGAASRLTIATAADANRLTQQERPCTV
jgi:hypothetical protein